MKFKVGDRVNYCATGTKYPGEVTVISRVGGDNYYVVLDNGGSICASESELEFIIIKCPVVAMGYGSSRMNQLTTHQVGTKVVMKPTANPNDVGSELAGSVGTIIDVPTLFSEHYEIEMGPAHNFQHVYTNDHQFSVYQDYEDFVTPVHQQRKKEGLCPTCGEKGHFSNFAFVCTKHGEY